MQGGIIMRKKGVKKMAVAVKPTNRVVKIEAKDSAKFIEEFNRNKVSQEFLNSCKKATRLFDRKTK